MNFFFIGKNFLVTGAGRGIGRALAKEIAKAGGVVYALSRTKETLDSLANSSDSGRRQRLGSYKRNHGNIGRVRWGSE